MALLHGGSSLHAFSYFWREGSGEAKAMSEFVVMPRSNEEDDCNDDDDDDDDASSDSRD